MTSVPPTQPPAAPETDVRLTEAIERGLRKCRVEDAPVSLIKEHDLFHVTHMVAAELAPLLAERVRVVEGERELLAEQYAAEVEELESDVIAEETRANENATLVHRERARAESAEAAHAALVKVLDEYFDFDIDPWDDHDGALPAPEDVWRLHRDLRALVRP